EAVGAENFFLFGLKAQQVEILKQRGYNPYYYYENDQRIRRIMDFVISDNINSSEPGKYKALADLLLQNGDQYCLLADLEDYIRVMRDIERCYQDPLLWNQMSAANIAGMGPFSSDETIRNYASKIWGF
ncbi:MAG: glycogen/starch/alpha-glucan phosphorylase, partial [Candidatus Cloacimonetes bacterium]|nr:glycogen/starch/alpha-glucan phosphorylase [Candidatus Cloacimonadota bacterium]